MQDVTCTMPSVRIAILDEADKLLETNFLDQVRGSTLTDNDVQFLSSCRWTK
jgi:superfamily II DNA/RNA helicase